MIYERIQIQLPLGMMPPSSVEATRLAEKILEEADIRIREHLRPNRPLEIDMIADAEFAEVQVRAIGPEQSEPSFERCFCGKGKPHGYFHGRCGLRWNKRVTSTLGAINEIEKMKRIAHEGYFSNPIREKLLEAVRQAGLPGFDD